MSVYIRRPIPGRIPLFLYIYPDPAPKWAFRARRPFKSICGASWDPSLRAAFLFAFSGAIDKRSALDILEALYDEFDVTRVGWVRASGKRVRKRRVGARRWSSL